MFIVLSASVPSLPIAAFLSDSPLGLGFAVALNAAAADAAALNMVAAQRVAALSFGTPTPYLPRNCNSSVVYGINYFNCGVFYRAGFQSNYIVYIVSAS